MEIKTDGKSMLEIFEGEKCVARLEVKDRRVCYESNSSDVLGFFNRFCNACLEIGYESCQSDVSALVMSGVVE